MMIFPFERYMLIQQRHSFEIEIEFEIKLKASVKPGSFSDNWFALFERVSRGLIQLFYSTW